MYDINWARSVYKVFKTTCTRAGNIDRCIEQRAQELSYTPISSIDLTNCLVFSIQYKQHNSVWRAYKAFCKASTFDDRALTVLADRILSLRADWRAHNQQLLLDIR